MPKTPKNPERSKKFLVVESGSRFNVTQYSHDKNEAPNGFAQKLRKHLKGKRLENVIQLKQNRTAIFFFGQDKQRFYLVLQMYGCGNLILTDRNFHIFGCLRDVRGENVENPIMYGETYLELSEYLTKEDFQQVVVCKPQSYWDKLTPEFLEQQLKNYVEEISLKDQEEDSKLFDLVLEKKESSHDKKKARHAVKRNKRPVNGSFLQFFIRELSTGPLIPLHCLLEYGLDPREKITNENIPNTLENFYKAFLLQLKLGSAEYLDEGYIITKRKKNPAFALQKRSKKQSESDLPPEYLYTYDEYLPMIPNQRKEVFQSQEEESKQDNTYEPTFKLIKFGSFSEAVDEFYSCVEAEKAESLTRKQEEAAWGKIERVRNQNKARLRKLMKKITSTEHSAKLIEQNEEYVNKAINTINYFLGN